MKELWRSVALAFFSALLAGLGFMLTFGMDAASKEYVDKRIDKTESRINMTLIRIEGKVDAHNDLHMRAR